MFYIDRVTGASGQLPEGAAAPPGSEIVSESMYLLFLQEQQDIAQAAAAVLAAEAAQRDEQVNEVRLAAHAKLVSLGLTSDEATVTVGLPYGESA